jgi:hypothetical protein
MLCQPTSRASLDAITFFSSRIQRIRPYDSNAYMADASVASGSVFITALLAFQFQRESNGSGSERMPSMTNSLANHSLNRTPKRSVPFLCCTMVLFTVTGPAV